MSIPGEEGGAQDEMTGTDKTRQAHRRTEAFLLARDTAFPLLGSTAYPRKPPLGRGEMRGSSLV